MPRNLALTCNQSCTYFLAGTVPARYCHYIGVGDTSIVAISSVESSRHSDCSILPQHWYRRYQCRDSKTWREYQPRISSMNHYIDGNP